MTPSLRTLLASAALLAATAPAPGEAQRLSRQEQRIVRYVDAHAADAVALDTRIPPSLEADWVGEGPARGQTPAAKGISSELATHRDVHPDAGGTRQRRVRCWRCMSQRLLGAVYAFAVPRDERQRVRSGVGHDQVLRAARVRQPEPDRQVELLAVVVEAQRRQLRATIRERHLLRVHLRDEELHPALDVRAKLRLGAGATVWLFNGDGHDYEATLLTASKRGAEAQIVGRRFEHDGRVKRVGGAQNAKDETIRLG